MIVRLSSVLPWPASAVRDEAMRTRLLRHVSAPWVTFTAIDPPALPEIWEPGRFRVAMRLGGLLPIGEQDIDIRVEVDDPTPGRECFVALDRGRGGLARRWDHRITIVALTGGGARYSDEVDVGAGVLTPAVWLFARLFFAHRQRRWRRLTARTRPPVDDLE
ncbi:MAG: hypothetical protein R3B09_12620 [Nannocystaceae bacterium]